MFIMFKVSDDLENEQAGDVYVPSMWNQYIMELLTYLSLSGARYWNLFKVLLKTIV